ACRILILDLEPVAVDPGLLDLLDRKLDALLILDPEIGTRPRHREQPPDLEHLVLRVRGFRGSEQSNAGSDADTNDGRMPSHGPLLKAIVSFKPETGMPANLISSRVVARACRPAADQQRSLRA